MGFKLRSSGLPFKEMGSSPAKQNDLTKETDNTRDNSEQTKKKSNISSTKGSSIITNTETGDTYNLRTGDTIKNKKPSMAGPRRKKSATHKPESPAKQTETGSDKQMREITERNTAKSKSKSSWDIGGYLKGEQGYIPDYKGESTKKTVNKVAKKVVKATDDKPKKSETIIGTRIPFGEAVTKGLVEGGKMGLMQKKGKLKKVNKKAPTLGPKKLPVNEGEPKRAVNHRS